VPADPAEVLSRWWRLIDARDWDALADLLSPDLRAVWLHTGEVFDAEGLVHVNRTYPGLWRAEIQECLADGARAVSRVRVSDGSAVFYAASFATVRAGRIVDLVELWAGGDEAPPPPPPPRRLSRPVRRWIRSTLRPAPDPPWP
jgi:hypothetical protein